MSHRTSQVVLWSSVLVLACSSEDERQAPATLTLRADVTPVTDVADAKSGVFIPPFEQCREVDGEEVCTNVAISGATEEGYAFTEQGDCEVVRTQRPYWPAPPASEAGEDDPRLEDDALIEELSWASSQIESTGCACCHDSRSGAAPSQWDIAAGPLWLDTLSDTGLALFAGLADSSVLGAYPKDDNHGFDRMATGIPTTDTERMKALLFAELERRGIREDEAAAVPPFGGPIYANSVRVPEPCDRGQGIDPEGRVRFGADRARYVYVLEDGSKNPGVPPNLDRPDGTLWKLDVLASADAIEDGFAYGTTPEGSFQAWPERGRAPQLDEGRTYHLVVLLDVGLPIASCTFEYGRALRDDASESDGGAADAEVSDAAGDGGEAGDGGGACNADVELGAKCSDAVTHSECGCDAPYCAIVPGDEEGYCTRTGCLDDPSVCPEGWSCFDVSLFEEGAPAVCLKP